MIELKLKEILEQRKINRYILQLCININYPRINQLYNKKEKNISFEESDGVTAVLNCSVEDLLVKEVENSKNNKVSEKVC